MAQKSTTELIREAREAAARAKQQPATADTTQTQQPKPKENPLKAFLPKATVSQQKPIKTTQGIPSSTPSYSYRGKQVDRNQVMDIIASAQNMDDFEGLSISDDQEMMDAFQARLSGAHSYTLKNPSIPQSGNQNLTNQFTEQVRQRLDPSNFTSDEKATTAAQNQQVAAREKRIDELPWYENAWRATKAGFRGMFSAGAATLGEVADIATTVNPLTGMPTAQGMMYGEATKSRLSGGPDVQAGAGLRKFAKEQKDIASEIEYNPESLSGIAGGTIPHITGTALAIASSPISAPVAAGIGGLSLGALTLSAVGGGIQEYDEYKEEKGLPKDQAARLGMGLLYGSSEFAMERLSLGRFVPKAFKNRVGEIMFGGVPPEILEKKGKELLEEFAKSGSSRRALVQNALKETGSGIVFEGNTDLATELANQFGTWLYKENEDKDLMKILDSAKSAWIGGAFMGGAMGPLSFGATRLVNDKRRKEQGEVILGLNTQTGEVVEIVGPEKTSKDGKTTYTAIRPNGKDTVVEENSISEMVRVPYDTFKGLLAGKAHGEKIVQEQKATAKKQQAQAEANNIVSQFQSMAYQGPDGTTVITGAKYNDEEVFVTNVFPDGTAVIQKPGEEKKVVRMDGLTDVETRPFDDFVAAFAPPQAFDSAQPTAAPIQKGEAITIEGQTYLVTGFDPESGIVQLENEQDEADLPTLTAEEFEQLRAIVPQQPHQASPAAEELRSIFLPQSNQQEFKPGEQVSFGKEQPQNARPAQPTATQPANVQTPTAQPVAGGPQPDVVGDGGQKPVGEGVDSPVQVGDIQSTHRVNVGQTVINDNVDDEGFVYFNSEEDAVKFANEVQRKTGDFLNVEKISQPEAQPQPEPLDPEVFKSVKAAVKMEYLSAKQLVKAKDPIEAKSRQEDLKKKHKKILQLIDCLQS